MTRDTQWIVTADERKALLHRCTRQERGQWRIEESKSLQNQWENYHEHHRPNALGRGPTANAVQHYAANEHEPEEEHRRFARDVVQWLTTMQQSTGTPHVDVFAATRFLGLLRQEVAGCRLSVSLHQAELTRLTPSNLAAHSGVLEVLNAPGRAKGSAT